MKCNLCLIDKELFTCQKCSDEMRMLMVNRILAETPEEKTHRLQQEILDKIYLLEMKMNKTNS